jgi:hypothetical protein
LTDTPTLVSFEVTPAEDASFFAFDFASTTLLLDQVGLNELSGESARYSEVRLTISDNNPNQASQASYVLIFTGYEYA